MHQDQCCHHIVVAVPLLHDCWSMYCPQASAKQRCHHSQHLVCSTRDAVDLEFYQDPLFAFPRQNPILSNLPGYFIGDPERTQKPPGRRILSISNRFTPPIQQNVQKPLIFSEGYLLYLAIIRQIYKIACSHNHYEGHYKILHHRHLSLKGNRLSLLHRKFNRNMLEC